jgi:hypothetical protein
MGKKMKTHRTYDLRDDVRARVLHYSELGAPRLRRNAASGWASGIEAGDSSPNTKSVTQDCPALPQTKAIEPIQTK